MLDSAVKAARPEDSLNADLAALDDVSCFVVDESLMNAGKRFTVAITPTKYVDEEKVCVRVYPSKELYLTIFLHYVCPLLFFCLAFFLPLCLSMCICPMSVCRYVS